MLLLLILPTGRVRAWGCSLQHVFFHFGRKSLNVGEGGMKASVQMIAAPAMAEPIAVSSVPIIRILCGFEKVFHEIDGVIQIEVIHRSNINPYLSLVP